MTDEKAPSGWFRDVDPDDQDATVEAIETGTAPDPADWPARAVDAGVATDEGEYYDRLREATIEATRRAIRARETADDQQLVHAVRSLDDCESAANELAERVAEWGSSLLDDTGAGIEYAERIATRDPEEGSKRQLVTLAERVIDLRDQADTHRRFVERNAPAVAPNLAALAGPVLAARLIALAGDLESLAKMPSSTVQVLGAEDALFAHLRSGADPPKHGIIFTHEYVNGTDPDHRGSAARALAGKLTIAARIDHYGDGYRPELETELDERIDRIRTRGGDEQ